MKENVEVGYMKEKGVKYLNFETMLAIIDVSKTIVEKKYQSYVLKIR